MIPGSGSSPWRRDRLLTPVFWGFSGGLDGKESACIVRDLGLIPGLGKSPGGGPHSSILDWRIPWTEEPGGHSPRGHKELDTTEHTHTVRAMKSPWSFRLQLLLSLELFLLVTV